MTFFKTKKNIIIIISLISAILFSIFSVLIANLIEKKNSTLEVKAAYTITDATSLASNYGSYKEFHINSLEGLKTFAGYLYSYNNIDQSFSGKTVVLKSDIDCGGIGMQIGNTVLAGRINVSPNFAGTFDGNGKTISNYKLSSNYIKIGGATNYIAGACGLFMQVSGTIKNLKVSSVVASSTGMSASGSGSTNVVQAALVGRLDGGTISNCSAEGFTGAYAESGIVAATFGGNVTNCYASDIVGSLSSYGIGPGRKTVPSSDTTTFDMTCNISTCITKGIEMSPLTSIYCYSEANNTLGLDLSVTWYYVECYNDGFPYLRQFLSWTALGFSLYGDSAIEQYVSVPSDGVDDAHASIASQLKNLTLNVFGQSVIAGKTDPYDFNGWERSGNNYYAQFSLKTFKISFVGQTNTTNTSSNLAFDTDYYIYYDATITISYTSYSKSGCYSSITYSFTDTGGTTRSITYYATNGHYLTTTSENTLSNITVQKDYNGLTVKTALKTYTPSFN